MLTTTQAAGTVISSADSFYSANDSPIGCSFITTFLLTTYSVHIFIFCLTDMTFKFNPYLQWVHRIPFISITVVELALVIFGA